ncbi:MAG: class II glutamine amidotransferase [Promethearchaeota archaeon]
MCGIAGIISKFRSTNIIPNLLSILTNLIDCGKDGTGIGYIDNNSKIVINKKDIIATKYFQEYKEAIECNIAIGHVRRPTIGCISELNSHPLMDCHENIAVIHNGTLKNYKSLRQELELEGHIFKGSVDSEVIPHLIEKYYDNCGNLEKSIQKTINQLEGYYTFAIISNFEPYNVYLHRHHYPLVLLRDDDRCYFSSERKPLAKLLNKSFCIKPFTSSYLEGL